MTRAVADLVGTMDGPLGAPSGTPHFCNNPDCYQTNVPRPDWKCPNCKRLMRWGHKYGPCPDCGERAFFTRFEDAYRCHCRCTWSPEELDAQARLDRERERREQKDLEERKRQCERSQAKLAEREARGKAKNCWVNLKHKACSVNKSELGTTAPYEFCKHCPKFKERP